MCACVAGPGQEDRGGGADAGGEPWDYTGCYPDPVCEEYGFKASKGRKAAVMWLDEAD